MVEKTIHTVADAARMRRDLRKLEERLEDEAAAKFDAHLDTIRERNERLRGSEGKTMADVSLPHLTVEVLRNPAEWNTLVVVKVPDRLTRPSGLGPPSGGSRVDITRWLLALAVFEEESGLAKRDPDGPFYDLPFVPSRH